METKKVKRSIALLAVLTILSLRNYLKPGAFQNIRLVDFLDILVPGILIGLLVMQVVILFKNKKGSSV